MDELCDWVVAAWVPRVAAANALCPKDNAGYGAMFGDRINGIHRTGWVEAAVALGKEDLQPAVIWRQRELVEFYGTDGERVHG